MKKYIIALVLLVTLVATPALAAQNNSALIQSLIQQCQQLLQVLQQMLAQQQTGQITSTTQPVITSVNPLTSSIGYALTIKGTNFDPVGGYVGNGWISNSHVFVNIQQVLAMGALGKIGVLWEGGSAGGNTSTSNLITVPNIPSQICKGSEIGMGDCPADKLMTLTPGNYIISVQVSGRGTSNSIPFSIFPPTTIQSSAKKYTDSNFGFSFYYPQSWSIQQGNVANPNLASTYKGGTLLKTITVNSPENPGQGIAIEEFTSSDKSITDNSNCGPADGCSSSRRYYFDSNLHTWMEELVRNYNPGGSLGPLVGPANVSVNSMGGLHILAGNARFGDNVIVPLSAKNFLIVHNVSVGTNSILPLAKTILALDPAVAIPVSQNEQNQTIQDEIKAYLGL